MNKKCNCKSCIIYNQNEMLFNLLNINLYRYETISEFIKRKFKNGFFSNELFTVFLFMTPLVNIVIFVALMFAYYDLRIKVRILKCEREN